MVDKEEKEVEEEVVEYKVPKEQDYNQPVVQQTLGGVSPPQQIIYGDASAGVIRELSTDKVLDRISNNLEGKYWNNDKKEYVKIHEPEMNEYGRSQIMSIITSLANDVLLYSNLPDIEAANALIMHNVEECFPLIFVYHRKYGIKKDTLPAVAAKIFDLFVSACYSSLSAGHRNVIRATLQENISQTPQPQPQLQQPGFFGMVENLGKKTKGGQI